MQLHGGLICITFCLSVWPPEDALMERKGSNMGTDEIKVKGHMGQGQGSQ